MVRLHDPKPVPKKPKAKALLPSSRDRYGGAVVELGERERKLAIVKFKQALSDSLDAWREEKVQGVWVKVPSDAARLLPVFIDQGFDFHHAAPGHAMLTKWLGVGESRLPLFPHHQVGAAGLVLGAGDQVLAIREASGVTANLQDFWKLPGGLVDPSEDIATAAVREVKEETGVDTEFVCIATCRESHQGPFQSSDLYCICILRLAAHYGDTLPEPHPQEKEIASAQWLPLDTFLGSKWYARGLYGAMLRTAAETAKKVVRGEAHPGLNAVQLPSLGGREERMYFAGTAKL